jgi:hypothetical protein
MNFLSARSGDPTAIDTLGPEGFQADAERRAVET